MIRIKNLEKKYLNQACDLLRKVFPEDDIAPESFNASLNKKKFEDFIKKSPLTRSLQFYVALNEKDQVIGTAGLYSLKEDYKDSYWLGWYCVDPEERGMGLGRKLLDYCIDKAKNEGKIYLKLRMSNDPEEKKAQRIYEMNEFYTYEDDSEYIKEQKKKKDGGYDKIFRRKKLN